MPGQAATSTVAPHAHGAGGRSVRPAVIASSILYVTDDAPTSSPEQRQQAILGIGRRHPDRPAGAGAVIPRRADMVGHVTGTPDERIAACKRIRAGAADALDRALREALRGPDPVTECGLRNGWLRWLREDRSIHADGWYRPPAHGIGVLVAHDGDTSRVHQTSLRTAVASEDVLLDREHGLFSAYCSPVDRATGVIGDFGMTVYLGDDPAIRNHIATALDIDRRVADHVRPGVRLSALATFAREEMERRGLASPIASITDPAGTNIGHSIPGIHDPWTAADAPLDPEAEWATVCDAISRRRIFVSEAQELEIRPGMAITVEPRPVAPGLPMVSFHTVVAVHDDGTPEWITGFDPVFDAAGMRGWLLEAEPR